MKLHHLIASSVAQRPFNIDCRQCTEKKNVQRIPLQNLSIVSRTKRLLCTVYLLNNEMYSF